MNTGLEQKARQNKQNSENNPSFKQSPDFQKYNWCDTETKDRLKSYGRQSCRRSPSGQKDTFQRPAFGQI